MPKSGDWNSVFSGLGSAQLLRLDDGGDIWPGIVAGTPCGEAASEVATWTPLLLLLLLLVPFPLIELAPVVVKTPRYEILLHPF